MSLVIGLDASTTAVTCCVFDPSGAMVSEGKRPIGLDNPEPLGYEQDANDWWEATCGAIREAVAPLDTVQLRGIAIAHQRETVVITDPSGVPLGPALVWMDERCTEQITARRSAGDRGRRERVERDEHARGVRDCASMLATSPRLQHPPHET